MTGLADKLNQATQHVADARRTRTAHPKGFEPGVKYGAGEPSEVTVTVTRIPENEQGWRDEITRVTGLDLSPDRRVELSQVRYWGPKDDPFIYCRFSITDRIETGRVVDAVSLLKDLRKGKITPKKTSVRVGQTASADSFVLSWNDWQVGKLSTGGTPALAERLDRSYDNAKARVKELRKLGRGLGHLVVIGGGDIIEGCSIFPHQSYELDSDRRTQVRNAVALALEGIDRLAPLFEKVTFLVVPGNHGENRVDGKRTNRYDNDDVAVFEHVALATSRDPKLQHVNFIIPQDEMSKTIEVSGWVLGTTHGHLYGKGSGGSIEQKALKWFSGQAAGRQPIGDSDVLVTHHFHHLAIRDWGATTWVQTPAMDGGSEWLTDMNGQSSQPGMLSFVMSPETKLMDLQIL